MSSDGLAPVTLSKSSTLKIRDEVFIVGAPNGTFPIETQGHVSLPKVPSADEELNGKIMCSLPIFKGNSGSPVYDSKGEVVGVIVMGDARYPNISFATPVKYLVSLMELYKEALKNQASSQPTSQPSTQPSQ
jgi:serine protease Do